jgi:hypothetical protein
MWFGVAVVCGLSGERRAVRYGLESSSGNCLN